MLKLVIPKGSLEEQTLRLFEAADLRHQILDALHLFHRQVAAPAALTLRGAPSDLASAP
jgi:ATP phosphoribosyltransferase